MNKENQNKKYTAAVVGTGRIGFSLGFDKKREQPASHTMSLLGNKRIKVVAGCDCNQKNLQEFKKYVEKFNSQVKIFSSLNDFLSENLPDIVVIAVNEDFHLEAALKVIESKPKLIIFEKPVALNVEEGNKIKVAAEENKVPVIVNHERRFAADYNFAKEYIKKIGKVLSINARLDSGLRVYSPATEAKGEYSLLHDGTHLVDVVLFLLNEQNLSKIKLAGCFYDEEDKTVVRGINVHCESTMCKDVNFQISGGSRYFGFEVDVIGSLGRIKIGNGIYEFYQRKESKLYTGFYSLATDSKISYFKKTGYFANMTQNAVDFLDGKCQLKSTLQTGLDTLEILEEITKQVKNYTNCGI